MRSKEWPAMKKTKLPFLLVTMIFLFTGCLPCRAQDRTFVKEVVYDVPIFNALAYTVNDGFVYGDGWEGNIESMARIPFQHMMVTKALTGAIKVYDEKGNVLSIDQVRVVLSANDTVHCQRLTPPFDEYDTIYEVGINPEEILWIRCKEQWTYDPLHLEIKKRIIAYAPLICRYDRQGKPMGDLQALFWIRCGSDLKKTVILTPLMVYRLPIDKNLREPGITKGMQISGDSLTAREYFTTLCNAIESGKQRIYESAKVYHYFRWTLDSIDFMPVKMASEKIYHIDTIKLTHPYPPYDDYDTLVPVRYTADGIVGMQFFERWILDPETMQLNKEVLGVDILEGLYDFEGVLEGSRSYFYVAFKNPERNFFK